MDADGAVVSTYAAAGGRAGVDVTFWTGALIAGAGFIAGAVNAVAGGGSLVSFPALVASGLPPLDANVTNTVAVWPGYIGSTGAYRRELSGQRDRLLRLAVTAMVGALAGAVVLLLAPPEVFDAIVPALILAGSALLLVQPRVAAMVRRRSTDTRRVRDALQLHSAVFVAGAYGAYFGGGLGVILLAVLGIFIADHLQRINALKTALSALINTVALAAFALFGPVDWLSVVIVAPAALAGGYAGGRVARVLSPGVLRLTVVGFGVIVAVWLALR